MRNIKLYIIGIILLFSLIFSLFIVIDYQVNKNSPVAKEFNNYEFDNVLINNSSFGIGYYFEIDSNFYYNSSNIDYLYLIDNLEKQKKLTNQKKKFLGEREIVWRVVSTPFYFSKKTNSDSLIIIKDGETFIFNKYVNTFIK